MTSAAPAYSMNLAFGKTALQSSVCSYSFKDNVQDDAGTATLNWSETNSYCHTDDEVAPWWSVDLGAVCRIEHIAVLNRRECSERLRNFTVLVSVDEVAETWHEIFKKDDGFEFGRGSDVPFIAKPSVPTVARHVRIRQDTPGYLHFRQCEVIGSALNADEVKIGIKTMQRIIREYSEKTEKLEQELQEGRSGFIVILDKRKVFVDTVRYSPIIVESLTARNYEHVERSIVPRLIKPGDRVLEVGTALGVVTMAAAAIVGPSNVMTFDANPEMIEDAIKNFKANELENIKARNGALYNRSRWSLTQSEADFFISKDFWISRFAAGPDVSDIIRTVRIPMLCLETQIEAHRANVLICDIEGGECDLLLGSYLNTIRLIILELHTWAVDRRKIDDMLRHLILTGFNIFYEHSAGGMLVLHRAP